MKQTKIFFSILLSISLVYLSVISNAQSPEKVSYQSVVRDASGELVRSQTVGIRISILQGTADGTAVYVEIHSPVTNINGLATIEVGNGTPVSETFSTIDWSDGPYFLKVETDPEGGNSYSIVGTSEIMSVPYALHAKTAETAETAQSVSLSSFQAPTATTLAATNVETNSATLNGIVNANGFLTTVVFQWGTTTAYGNEISTTSVTGTGNESVSEDLNGLDYGETYHYRIKTVNAVNETFSSDMPFTTSMSLPQLTTSPVTSVLSTSATSGGNITSDGGSSVTARGVCWNTTGDPTTADSKTTDGTGVGSFVSSITGLSTGTTYYVRAYATNSAGTCYGDELEFTTSDHDYGSFIDSRDSHEYRTIEIGTQTWMVDNLAWLPSVCSPSSRSVDDPYYYVYGYEGTDVSAAKAAGNYETYGVLYNWPAASVACPSGWHLPNEAEWTTLSEYLTNNGYGYEGSGNDIGKALAATTLWNSSATAGYVGNDMASNNSSGFGGLPGGRNEYFDGFCNVGILGYWWSATDDGYSILWYRGLLYDNPGVHKDVDSRANGFSVRCISD